MKELLQSWELLNGRRIGETICRPKILSSQQGSTHLALELTWSDAVRAFRVDFWVYETPNAKTPVKLLNTRVLDRDGSAKDIYPDILGIFCEIFPPHTPLKTFVRQADSLSMLESTARSGDQVLPSALPLVQMFELAGWKFISIAKTKTDNPLRRYVIEFETR